MCGSCRKHILTGRVFAYLSLLAPVLLVSACYDGVSIGAAVQEASHELKEGVYTAYQLPLRDSSYQLWGDDAELFTVSDHGGVVPRVALDFENPADANGDNIYQLTAVSTSTWSPDVRLRVNVVDRLVLGPPTLQLDSTTRQLDLIPNIEDPWSGDYALAVELNRGGGSGFSPLDFNGDNQIDTSDWVEKGAARIPVPTTGLLDDDFTSNQYRLEALDSQGRVLADSASVGAHSFSTRDLTRYLKADNSEANDLFGRSVALSGDGLTLAIGTHKEGGAGRGINPAQDNNAAGAGAVYVYRREGAHWRGPVYLKASNTGAGDEFGYRLSLSEDGSVLVVGAWAEHGSGTGLNPDDNDDASYSGAVYVFRHNGSDWQSPVYLKASDTEAGDWFGSDVAISGDGTTMVIGAPGRDSASGDASGAVYVYEFDGSSWGEPSAILEADNPGAGDWFGEFIALSADGTTLAVGATFEDGAGVGINPAHDDSASDAGAAYIFRRQGASWVGPTYLKANNTDAGDKFGSSLALSADGHTLAVGALQEDGAGVGVNPANDNSASNAGAVYVYRYDGSDWQDSTYLKASYSAADYWFSRVALSADGRTLAVGANGDSGDPADASSVYRSGAAYIFRRLGGDWQGPDRVTASNIDRFDWFGSAVSLSADGANLAVGAYGEDGAGVGLNPADNNDETDAGAVYLF